MIVVFLHNISSYFFSIILFIFFCNILNSKCNTGNSNIIWDGISCVKSSSTDIFSKYQYRICSKIKIGTINRGNYFFTNIRRFRSFSFITLVIYSTLVIRSKAFT